MHFVFVNVDCVDCSARYRQNRGTTVSDIAQGTETGNTVKYKRGKNEQTANADEAQREIFLNSSRLSPTGWK